MISIQFKILLIDKDEELLATSSANLSAEGYLVLTCSNSKQAIQLAREEVPHLIILELEMPEMDGIEICTELKLIPELASTIIVFYTQRSEEYSQVTAFNAGADDYIIKHVKARVLASRIKALLKRHTVFSELLNSLPEEGLIIDRESYLIYKDGVKIILPRKEFELLSLLYSSPQKVFTRKEISQLIWGYEIFAKNRTIDVHIRKIREKLGDKYIKTIKGIGYRLDI